MVLSKEWWEELGVFQIELFVLDAMCIALRGASG